MVQWLRQIAPMPGFDSSCWQGNIGGHSFVLALRKTSCFYSKHTPRCEAQSIFNEYFKKLWDSPLYAMIAGISHTITFNMCNVVCKGIQHDNVVCILAMWYDFSISTMWCYLCLQFGIFKGHKSLKPCHKKKTKFEWFHRVILHSLGDQLHHTRPSVSCDTKAKLD